MHLILPQGFETKLLSPFPSESLTNPGVYSAGYILACMLLLDAVASLVLADIIPLLSRGPSSATSTEASAGAIDPASISPLALTLPTNIIAFIYAYTRPETSLTVVLSLVVNGVLTAWGIWAAVFGSDEPSKGSGWLFQGEERRRRKAEKRERKWKKVDRVR